MSRVVIKLKNDKDNYVNVEAEEFHEDKGFIKAYNSHNELVALADINEIRIAYLVGGENGTN